MNQSLRNQSWVGKSAVTPNPSIEGTPSGLRPPSPLLSNVRRLRNPPMAAIRLCALPTSALLETYAQMGAFTDCYVIELLRPVAQGEFVEAFYTSSIFKVERWMLAKFLSQPSTGAEAHRLATGALGTFAAWSVERRETNQILLAAGRTRSWLMASSAQASGTVTRLSFGSAVLPRRTRGFGVPRMGWQFRVLLGLSQGVFASSSCLGLPGARSNWVTSGMRREPPNPSIKRTCLRQAAYLQR